MINYMPVMQYVLEYAGKRHRVKQMIEEIHDLDWSVLVVNDGGLPYRNVEVFVTSIENSFEHYEKSYHISASTVKIDPHRIVIFKR